MVSDQLLVVLLLKLERRQLLVVVRGYPAVGTDPEQLVRPVNIYLRFSRYEFGGRRLFTLVC